MVDTETPRYTSPFGSLTIQSVRAPLRRQLSALFILTGWIGAVFVCAIKPLAHCGPASSAERSHQIVLADYHDTEDHHHDDAHHEDASRGDTNSGVPCSDDPSCEAINSAFNTASMAALRLPCAKLLYEVFQPSTVVQLGITLCDSARAKERVLLLTHEMCNCVNSFALAPPSA